jgi:glucan-binding YG repeat protein
MKKYLFSFIVLLIMVPTFQSKASAFNDKDCGDFSSGTEVMEFWYNNGYSASYDPHRLDGDNDGLPCEISQSEYDDYVAGKKASQSFTGWKYSNDAWYYYQSNSKHTGWLSYNGDWYYLNSSGVMQTGWEKISGKWYYFLSSGQMDTGWIKSDGVWYYLTSSGSMATGWEYVSGSWYYLGSSGAMETGWLLNGGQWYYLDSSGEMATDWAKVNGKWYYLNDSGVMQTGWVRTGMDWYYLNSNGSMMTGWIQSGSKWYYLYSDGRMASDTIIVGDYINFEGEWIKPNSIETSVSSVTSQYGVEVVSVHENSAVLLKDGLEIGSLSTDIFSVPLAYKDMLVDMTYKYDPDFATKEELYNYLDMAINDDIEVVVGDYEGLVSYWSEWDQLNVVFSGFDY